jgi:hypothetical protein
MARAAPKAYSILAKLGAKLKPMFARALTSRVTVGRINAMCELMYDAEPARPLAGIDLMRISCRRPRLRCGRLAAAIALLSVVAWLGIEVR